MTIGGEGGGEERGGMGRGVVEMRGWGGGERDGGRRGDDEEGVEE